MQAARAAFPVGLYGLLLIALCWLAVPALFAPVERWLLGLACLPLRVLAHRSEVHAAADADAALRIQALGDELLQRVAARDRDGAGALFPAHAVPVHCAVAAAGRPGGGGVPAELRLSRSYAELADCGPLVTKGDALLGFLLVPGQGLAVEDQPGDPARVLLLNHPRANPVAAAMALPDGGSLRLVVRAAAPVDAAPLRVDLWDDPYRAANLTAGGVPVTTLDLPEPGALWVPGGLLLGRSRPFGYTRGDASLTIAVFVEPAVDPRAVSHVVLWRMTGAVAPPGPATSLHPRANVPAVLRLLPGTGAGRWLCSAPSPVIDGAAVLVDGLCVGTVRALAFGQGLVTSFPASRHRWTLLLLPDDPAARPRELCGEVVSSNAGEALLRCSGGDRDKLPSGYLFTGSNGPQCPAGLLLGRASPVVGEPELLAVRTPALPPFLGAAVVAGGQS